MALCIGILALQGCVDPHRKLLQLLDVPSIPVRYESELSEIDALILPGGESTTMLRLMQHTQWPDKIRQFEKPLWGICAGSILLAKEVLHPAQDSFGLIDIVATRNAYGSQLDSFHAEVSSPWDGTVKSVDFIRAPKLEPAVPEVTVHLEYKNQPVLLEQGRVLCSAFHTELGDDPWLHQYFLRSL